MVRHLRWINDQTDGIWEIEAKQNPNDEPGIPTTWPYNSLFNYISIIGFLVWVFDSLLTDSGWFCPWLRFAHVPFLWFVFKQPKPLKATQLESMSIDMNEENGGNDVTEEGIMIFVLLNHYFPLRKNAAWLQFRHWHSSHQPWKRTFFSRSGAVNLRFCV